MDGCSEVDEHVTGFGKSRYLVRKSRMFIKNEAKIMSRVYCV